MDDELLRFLSLIIRFIQQFLLGINNRKIFRGQLKGRAMLASASVLNLVLALALSGNPGSTPAQASGTHSPHGNLNIPCQNCHTASGWKPIRAVPEFDHNQTRYPLRGMHQSVTCVQCHVKPVFNNVGQSCQDCHADIHRRQLGANCEQCHTVRGWTVTVQQIQDHNNRFPLTGAHAAVDCDACHKNGANSKFETMSTACYSCHQSDFVNTSNPNHVSSKFSVTCETCHSTDNWLNAKFDHNATGFPLTGAHMVPPRACTDCHTNNNYNLTSTACISCHLTDFQNTNNPSHVAGGFAQTCQECHSTVAWAPASFDHNTVNFPLTGAHSVPPRACADCHANNNFNLTTTACVSCHMKDFQSTTNPNHAAGGFAQTCETCHTTTAWQPATFDHSKTAFPLTGSHTVPPRMCTDCHVNNNYNITVTTCVSCHQTDYNNATTPVLHTGFPTTCEQCHDTVQWTDGKFDHSTTGFTLTGLHTVPPRQCTDCHNGSAPYSLTSGACATCHMTDYNGTTNPNHKASNFSTSCDQCHSTSSWSNAVFNHNNTGFPLTGSHTVPPRACTDCHVNNNYSITVTTCVSCHQTDYNNATTPVSHTGLPTTCEQCHDTVQWTDGKFDHSTTGFTLTGLHTVPPRQCTDCHNATFGGYNIQTTACYYCHQTDYNGTTNPNHKTSNLPTACDQCHSTSSWLNATFNHNSTGFPLTGSHTVPPRACTDCHINNNYSITATACVSCHQTDYNNATTPVAHAAAGFPTTCQQCHDTVAWTDGTFNHTATGFPLTGLHTVPPRQCSDCHTGANPYGLSSTACATCHLKDYQGTTNPNHVTANFPQTCDQCHSTSTWLNATFNHNSTGFSLTGAHTVPPRACTDCHINNNYNITNTTCVSCHQTDYNTATTPVNHVAANFPTTCETCHDTVLWTDGTFNHASTGFTLTGAHTVPPRACSDCHKGASPYALNSTACVTCHLTDYNGTTNPNHVTSGFPQQCDLCHDTTVWTDSTFNHNNTAFPLTGAHTTTACALCHVNGNYTTLPTTCVGCHQTDYNNTTNPGHSAQPQFFPTTCTTCHTTTAWTGATFNHTQYTQFSINHGNANGVCATCHINSNNYSVFQCTACHGGNNAANFGHPNVNGYVYNSINCYQCHSSGGGG